MIKKKTIHSSLSIHTIIISTKLKGERRRIGLKIQLQTTLVDCSRLNLILDSLRVLYWNKPRAT